MHDVDQFISPKLNFILLLIILSIHSMGTIQTTYGAWLKQHTSSLELLVKEEISNRRNHSFTLQKK